MVILHGWGRYVRYKGIVLGGWRESALDDDDACFYTAALLSLARLDEEGWRLLDDVEAQPTEEGC